MGFANERGKASDSSNAVVGVCIARWKEENKNKNNALLNEVLTFIWDRVA